MEQVSQGISLNILLQHQRFAVLSGYLIDVRQIRTGDLQQLTIDIRGSVQSSEDELLSGLSVTEQTDAASWTLFDDMHQIVLLMEDIEQPVVKHFQKISILCCQHIVSCTEVL